MSISLSLFKGSDLLFSSESKWLHPLFELEDFLNQRAYDPTELYLEDKIAGRAAASLIVRLGIKKCHINLVSRKALFIFNKYDIEVEYRELVDKIKCRTEDLLDDEMDLDDVWQILRRRAGRVKGYDLNVSDVSVEVENRTLLDGLNLVIPKGEGAVIKGANGAGKTTLLKTILGLHPLKAGVINIGLLEVGSKDWRKQRFLTAYVNQENVKSRFPVTASEVVGIGLSGSRLSSKELHHRVEIAMKRMKCYHIANQSYHDLSGGEKQRVSLARCLCQQARILLLDEPTTYLDEQAKSELISLLHDLMKGEAPTMLIVSHDNTWMDALNFKVYELKGGKLC